MSAQPKATPKVSPSSVPPRPRLDSVRPMDSDAPRSGVRLAAPLAVPRPARRPGSLGDARPRDLEDTFVEQMPPPAWVDAPPLTSSDHPAELPTASRPGRAAVRPRPARVLGAVVLPPALTASVAPASVPGVRAAPPAAPSSYKFRSFVETAQDWPIVDPSSDGAGIRRPPPRFGLDLSNASRGSLPAFVPPESLRLSLAPANDSFPDAYVSDLDEVDLAARGLEAAARRARWIGVAALALALVCVLAVWISS